MKSIKILILAVAAFALASCCNNEPKQFVGTIMDATMGNVVVKELTSDQTAMFSTEGADMTQANGMLIGNIITVDYKGKLQDVTPAIKVTTDATYAKAVGEWTMPDPINPDSSSMGIRVMVEGEAESINMATLRYSGWELQGEPIAFSQTAVLGTNAEGREILSIEDTEIVLTKQAL